MRPPRQKACARCSHTADVLFRARRSALDPWKFVCVACLPALKDQNPNYQYGGTWKARKAR